MERRWFNKETKEIGLAFVTDKDDDVLTCFGYEHCSEEDFIDDELDGEYVEVWKPINK